jgi:hypothetical protein
VDEHVRTAIVRLDEAEAAIGVKELYGSGACFVVHGDFLSIDIEPWHRQNAMCQSFIENEREDRSGRKNRAKTKFNKQVR